MYETLRNYQTGYNQGTSDIKRVKEPFNSNGYTETEYLEIRARAYAAYYYQPMNKVPEYERGYCDGADDEAEK